MSVSDEVAETDAASFDVNFLESQILASVGYYRPF